ncbi:acyl carrier protein [Actinorhabdospora filicis]|nr:phosphopantetheine-binding protein [Actinorhabdospora filicis]
MSGERVRAVLIAAAIRIKPELGYGGISGAEHITADWGLDSVDRMELLIAVEEAFGIEDEVDPRVFMTPASVNDLTEQIMAAEAALR